MVTKRLRRSRKLQTPTNDAWFLDLGCGVGGLSLGFLECGFAVCGVDKNPDAVAVYRARVGPAEVLELSEVRPDHRFTVVGYHAASLGDRAGWSQKPGNTVREALRVAGDVQASAVVILAAGRTTKTSRDAMIAAMKAAGFYGKAYDLNLTEFLVPQSKWYQVFVGFRVKRCARLFRPPTNPSPLRTTPATVYGALAIPYPHPSPPITTTEWKSSYVGARGGQSSLRRASEIMAETVGVGRWREYTDGRWYLSPTQLAVLQGLPSTWKWGNSAKESALVGGAVSPCLTKYLADRVWLALRDGGDLFASPGTR